MIQTHYIYYALLFLLLMHQLHFRSPGVRSQRGWDPCLKVLEVRSIVPSRFSQGGKFCMGETLSRIPSLQLCCLEGMTIPLTPIGKLSSPGFKGAPSQAGGRVLGTRGIEASGSFLYLCLSLTHTYSGTHSTKHSRSFSLSQCVSDCHTHTHTHAHSESQCWALDSPLRSEHPSPLPSLLANSSSVPIHSPLASAPGSLTIHPVHLALLQDGPRRREAAGPCEPAKDRGSPGLGCWRALASQSGARRP